MYYTTNIWIFFDIGMFVMRSPISVQVSKKVFGIINKRGGGRLFGTQE